MKLTEEEIKQIYQNYASVAKPGVYSAPLFDSVAAVIAFTKHIEDAVLKKVAARLYNMEIEGSTSYATVAADRLGLEEYEQEGAPHE
jgi:hypothetical protein